MYIYHHWEEKKWALLLLILVSDISNLISIYFPLFLASTKTGEVFLHLLWLLPCCQWGFLSYIYTSAFQKGKQEEKGVGEEDKICAWALLWDGVRMHLGCWTLKNTLLLLVSNSWPLWPCEEKDGRNSTEISVSGKQYAAIILFCPCYLGGTHPPDNQSFQYLLNISWQKYQDFLI